MYKSDYEKNIRGRGHSIGFTPEMERARENQKNLSQVLSNYISNLIIYILTYSKPEES